jgi:hypothetical protein
MKRRGETNIMQDWPVDLQHGTGCGWEFASMYPTSPLQARVFIFMDPHIKLLYLVHKTVLILFNILLTGKKNKPR